MSGGPHLHYEVRNTRTQQSLNPLQYGITLVDNNPPAIKGIRLLPVDKNSRVNSSKTPYQVELSGKDSRLGTAVNPIAVLGRFYIGVYASDQSDGSTPNNGFDRIDIWVDGRPFFQYKMDIITYSEEN